MPLCVAVSALGAALGTMFSSARIAFAAGRDAALPRCLARVSPWAQTPYRAVALQYVQALALVAVGNFESLLGFFGCATWLFYVAAVLGLLRLRRLEPDLPRPYRVPWPVAAIFCATALALLATVVASSPATSLTAFAFMASGVPVWYCRVRRGARCCCASCERVGGESDSAEEYELAPVVVGGVGGARGAAHDLDEEAPTSKRSAGS